MQYFVDPECVSPLQVILVATANSSEGMQQSIRRCFRHEIAMKTMNEEQKNKLISETLQGIATAADEVPFSHFSAQNFFSPPAMHLLLIYLHFSEYR